MNPLLTLALQPWAVGLGWTLVHFLWQGAALGLLAWACLSLLRGASARARYGLACAFLVLMVAAPAATFLLLQRQAPGAPSTVILRSEAAPSVSAQPSAPLRLNPQALTQRLKAQLDPTLPWLLATWGAGVLLLSARFLGGWVRVTRLRRQGAGPVPAEWHLVLSRLCRDLKLNRTVRLLQSAAVEVPTALGWLYPIILLPACALTGLAPLQLEAILAHELAHIRRGDFLVNLVQSLVEVLLFYHPAVWWLSGRIRAERELCCDDVAAALCGDPLLLARALTDLEALREPLNPSPAHLALAANGGSLMHRVRHLLHPTLPLTSGARASALALLAASLLGAAGVALQDKGQATPKADKNTRLKVVDEDRKLDVRLKGEVQLDAAAKEPVTVPGEGSFRIEEKKGGSIRAYAATKDQRTYTVDGKDRPLDAEGEAWLREVVKEAAQAQASSPKARKLTVRTHVDGDKHTHDIEVHAKALEAHARELEAHAKALEAQDLSPSERARIQAEMDRARADLAKAKADLKKEIRVQVVEGRGPATVIVTEGGNGKAQVEKRVKILRKDGKESTWTVIGPDREHVIIDESGQEIRIPPIHIPKIHVRPFAPPPREDAQEEMAEIKAALKALQTRLEQLQKQMGPASAGPRNPKPPAKPKPFPPPPPSPPLPPPPPLPAPGSPDAPPPPPPPPPPPAPDAPPEPPAPPPPPRL